MASACSDLSTEYLNASAAPLSATFSPLNLSCKRGMNIAIDHAPTSHVTNNHYSKKTILLTQQNQENLQLLPDCLPLLVVGVAWGRDYGISHLHAQAVEKFGSLMCMPCLANHLFISLNSCNEPCTSFIRRGKGSEGRKE